MRSALLLLALVALCRCGPDFDYSDYSAYDNGAYVDPYASNSYGYNGPNSIHYITPPSTRENCPPAGYKALGANYKLDKLKPGKYAICLTPVQAEELANGDDTSLVYEFNHSGLWKMQDSILIVDSAIQININYPGRLDWSNVIVTRFSQFDNLVGTQYTGWRGIRILGAYQPGNPKCPPQKGFCASLDKVRIDGVQFETTLFLQNCSSLTTANKLGLRRDADVAGQAETPLTALHLEDTNGVIFNDLRISSPGFYFGVRLEASQAAFVRPQIYNAFSTPPESEAGFLVYGGSSTTICDPFITSQNKIIIGDGGSADMSNAVAVSCGLAWFPEDVSFNGEQGVLYTLGECPTTFKPTYPISKWLAFYTVENAD